MKRTLPNGKIVTPPAAPFSKHMPLGFDLLVHIIVGVVIVLFISGVIAWIVMGG